MHKHFPCTSYINYDNIYIDIFFGSFMRYILHGSIGRMDLIAKKLLTTKNVLTCFLHVIFTAATERSHGKTIYIFFLIFS